MGRGMEGRGGRKKDEGMKGIEETDVSAQRDGPCKCTGHSYYYSRPDFFSPHSIPTAVVLPRLCYCGVLFLRL